MSEEILNCLRSPADAWTQVVWQHYGGKCANCGSQEHLAIRLVVPEEAGGKKVLTNCVLICRACEIAKVAVEKAEVSGKEPRRPVNIWVSQDLYRNLGESLRSRNGFRSMGALSRFMMSLMIREPDRFPDLHYFQDRGSDVKVNLWVDHPVYEAFKEVLAARGLTVTEALKGLFLMYIDGAVRKVSHVDES